MGKVHSYIAKITDNRHKNANIFVWIVFIASILILGLSSYYVANKSAIIHSNNTDHLIDSYMFESSETFKESIFPAAHSFLFKWPLFALSSSLGNTSTVYILLTVLIYSLTVFSFLYVIHRLCKKNKLITALIALSLSSILLFIPAQPMHNTYLPVNMAMLTTRNLEFIVFFIFIYLVINTKKINSSYFYLSILTLGILGASDKYFLMLALLGAVGVIVYQTIFIKNAFGIKNFIPIFSAVISYILATTILATLNLLDITNIPNSSDSSPFALASSAWQMLEAFTGAIQAILVNFGTGFFGRPVSISLLPYMINGVLFLLSGYAIWRLFLNRSDAAKYSQDTNWQFTLWLVMTSFAAIILFTASNHEYLKDARYLTGVLFAGMGAVAYLLSTLDSRKSHRALIIGAVILLLMIPLSFIFARTNFTQAIHANQQDIGTRTDQASSILAQEDADLFVSDYWFSAPTKLKLSDNITIIPMSTDACDTPNTFLISNNWLRPSSEVDRSAYYILRDASPDANTYNHGCTMEYIDQKYGKPEKEFVIRGTKEQPIDIIRIYPYDVRQKFSQ